MGSRWRLRQCLVPITGAGTRGTSIPPAIEPQGQVPTGPGAHSLGPVPLARLGGSVSLLPPPPPQESLLARIPAVLGSPGEGDPASDSRQSPYDQFQLHCHNRRK